MAALNANKSLTRIDGVSRSLPVKAATHIYAGAMVMVLAGSTSVQPAASGGTTSRVAGVAIEEVDNSAGANGDKVIQTMAGTFLMANHATNTLTLDDIGEPCYVEDDQTVGSLATARPVAGTVFDVTAEGVWVRID